jgi:hypothetical protein
MRSFRVLLKSMAVLAAATVAMRAGMAAGRPAAYCEQLKQVAALAMSKDRFATVAGKQREGSFVETTLPLPGWNDCVLYGSATYTCDSKPVPGAVDIEKEQARIVDEILSCFAGAWLHVLDRSSPAYAVLHPTRGAASITLNVDQTDNGRSVVRLNLFVRRN